MGVSLEGELIAEAGLMPSLTAIARLAPTLEVEAAGVTVSLRARAAITQSFGGLAPLGGDFSDDFSNDFAT